MGEGDQEARAVAHGGCLPGMAPRCRVGCLHRQRVEEYRLARHAQLQRAEAYGAYAPGTPEWRSFFRHSSAPNVEGSEEPLTFRAWLIGLAHHDDDGSEWDGQDSTM